MQRRAYPYAVRSHTMLYAEWPSHRYGLICYFPVRMLQQWCRPAVSKRLARMQTINRTLKATLSRDAM